MKKFCFLLVIFAFVSAMPCFALKVILNDNSDRRVPSRCSGPADEYYIDDSYQYGGYTTQAPTQYKPVSNYNPAYELDKFETLYKPLLSKDIRRELVGTNWYYPKYVKRYNPKTDYTVQTVNTAPQTTYTQTSYIPVKHNKRYLREAADYFTYDNMIEGPDKIFPAGFEI